ncbi:Serine proteinase [Aphelenchoides bicaudatus]|nr:Serine proteinase [Aphelenchoides bicaudatus]
MHWLWAFLLLWISSPLVAGQQACGITANHTFSRFDFNSPNDRLVGGTISKPHSYPWVGEILLNDRHHCGCALIDTQFVVTAAHCFAHSRDPSVYKVLLGGHVMFSGESFEVKSIAVHQLYQIRASAYDVALLRIAPAAQLDSTINTICLPFVPPLTHQMCVVAGWGRLKEGGERSHVLREIHIPIVAPTVCNDLRHYAGLVFTPTMICAGYSDGRMDACQGDSGGPLMCLTNGVWQLQGIVSWGIGCAKPNFPGVYTKVSAITGWIRSQQLLM